MTVTLELRRNGSVVDVAAEKLSIRRLSRSARGNGAALYIDQSVDQFAPTFKLDDQVDLYVNGQWKFRGWIERRERISQTGDVIRYVARDPFYRARQLTVRHPSGIPRWVFNADEDDPDYDPAFAGLTAGQILQKIFERHNYDLWALGINPTVDASALFWVPRRVEIIDSDLIAAIEDVVRGEDGVLWWYDPTDGWHFVLATSLPTTVTLTIGQDSILRDAITESGQAAWTACRIIGREQTEVVWLKLSDGSLLKDWDQTLESGWTWDNAFAPQPPVSGTPTAWSQTYIDDTNQNWSTDEWKDATIRLVDTSKSPPEAVIRRVAGNTATRISWDYPVNLANISVYELVRYGWGANRWVWRRFKSARQEDRKLAYRSDWPFTLPSGLDVFYIELTGRPVLLVEYENAGQSLYFPVPHIVDPIQGVIVAAYPVVQLGNDATALNTPGGATPPKDVHFVGPVYKDPLIAAYPAGGTPTSWTQTSVTVTGANWTPDEWKGMVIELNDGVGNIHVATVTTNDAETISFSPGHSLTAINDFQVHGGDAATGTDGLRHTYVVHRPEWRSPQLTPTMVSIAKHIAQSRWRMPRVVNLPVEGFFDYLPAALRIASVHGTTGLEDADIPILELEHEFGGLPLVTTTIRASSDVRAWQGMDLWLSWIADLPVVPILRIERVTRRSTPIASTVRRIREARGV